MRFFFKILLLCSFLLIVVNGAFSTTMNSYTNEEIASQSDEIIIGECVKKQSKWVGGHIETTINIKVSEVLKGTRKAGDNLEITQAGGELKNPPIGQYIPMMPHFYEGEKSLLFLSSKHPKKPKNTKQTKNPNSKLQTSPYVVGMYQGKFTIVEDTKSGKKYAVRYNFEKVNMLPKDEYNKKIDRALANQAKMVSDGSLKHDNTSLTPEEASKLKKNNEVQKKIKDAYTNPKVQEENQKKTEIVTDADEKLPKVNIKNNSKKDKSIIELDEFKKEINGYIK